MKIQIVFNVLLISLAGQVGAVWATPIDVGAGANSAGVIVEWSDGFIADFIVSFDTETISGLDALDIIKTASALPPISNPLTTVRQVFDFGVLIDGITFDGHSDIGFGGGENWWHQWVKNDGQEWGFGPGVSDRILSGGDMDAYIYGRAGAPIPEPVTLTFLALGAAALRRRSIRKVF